jgi:DNA-binding HxlR family transcriptional regulator
LLTKDTEKFFSKISESIPSISEMMLSKRLKDLRTPYTKHKLMV